jgi:hypothetical protein
MSMFTPLFGFLPHKIHRINNLTFFSREMGLAAGAAHSCLASASTKLWRRLKGAASYAQETATQVCQSFCGPYNP